MANSDSRLRTFAHQAEQDPRGVALAKQTGILPTSIVEVTEKHSQGERWRTDAACREQITRALLASARKAKLERGRVVRLDSTVTAALMHEPSDSSLLWDAVRVMARLLKEAKALGAGIALALRDHRRAAKKRARDIQYIRGGPNGCSSIAS